MRWSSGSLLKIGDAQDAQAFERPSNGSSSGGPVGAYAAGIWVAFVAWLRRREPTCR